MGGRIDASASREGGSPKGDVDIDEPGTWAAAGDGAMAVTGVEVNGGAVGSDEGWDAPDGDAAGGDAARSGVTAATAVTEVSEVSDTPLDGFTDTDSAREIEAPSRRGSRATCGNGGGSGINGVVSRSVSAWLAATGRDDVNGRADRENSSFHMVLAFLFVLTSMLGRPPRGSNSRSRLAAPSN